MTYIDLLEKLCSLHPDIYGAKWCGALEAVYKDYLYRLKDNLFQVWIIDDLVKTKCSGAYCPCDPDLAEAANADLLEFWKQKSRGQFETEVTLEEFQDLYQRNMRLISECKARSKPTSLFGKVSGLWKGKK